MLNKFSLSRIAKITAELWRFLLFLSQDYSHYYSSVRTLCVSIFIQVSLSLLIYPQMSLFLFLG